MNVLGATQHRGNNAGTKVANCVCKAYFARNTASLIEKSELKTNGQSHQNINQFGYIYNLLHDFTGGHEASGKNKIGSNADPSLKSTWKNGKVV